MGDSTPDSTPRKDRRLYAKFDIGMDEHAKIIVLSDAAFRALFESTLYSRRQLTDGFLDERIVLRKWGADIAAELTSNDPQRPSWIKVDGGWMIHDFAQHQTTNKDIEAKREAGRKGGLAKAEQNASKPVAPATEVPKQVPSNSLAKTETETDTKKKDLSSKRDEFDQWYAAYPKKEAKEAARKAFAKARKSVSLEDLLEGVRRYAISVKGKERQFIALPASWLNAGRWDDEIPGLFGGGGEIDVDAILGRDVWTPGAPPPGLSVAEEIEWKKQQRAAHIAERLEEAKRKLGVAA